MSVGVAESLRGAQSEEDSRGIVLPIALFFLLALGAICASVLVFSRAELVLERGNLLYLEHRISSEARLDPWISGSEGVGGRDRVSLGGGFVLVRASEAGEASAPMAVHFDMNPDSIAGLLPAAVEVGHAAPSGTSRPIEVCDGEWPVGQAVVRVRPAPTDPLPDPPLPSPPRLGTLGIEDLVDLGSVDLLTDGTFPSDSRARILQAPAGARLVSGAGHGVLVSTGDLTLEGEASFRGVVLTTGELHLLGAARIEGVVLAGGAVWIAEGARLLACPAVLVEALNHEELSRLHPVRGGRLLGRF